MVITYHYLIYLMANDNNSQGESIIYTLRLRTLQNSSHGIISHGGIPVYSINHTCITQGLATELSKANLEFIQFNIIFSHLLMSKPQFK